MKDLFEYTDYREFLRDHYENKKNRKPFYSYRFIASRVGINPGFIARVFSGKVHLGIKKAPIFADLMDLKGKGRSYFLELVAFGRAKREEEIRESFKRLQSIKGLDFRTFADDQMAFFEKWHHMAMRSLLSIYPFNGKNFKKLGSLMQPSLSAMEARESVALLERLGLIQFDKSEDRFNVLDTYVTTREKWSSSAIQDYQKTTIKLSLNALETLPKTKRDISTVTFTCSRNKMEALRQRLNEFRQEMLRLSEDGREEDCVMHLNLQLFPSAELPGENL